MNILFTSISVVSHSIEELSLLYNTAQKYFLSNHNVDFVLFSDDDIIIDGVKTIKIEKPHLQSINYYQFLKVLSLNTIDLDQYDYVFVNDTDQMFVNPVSESDVLTNELCILSHFYPNIKTKEQMVFWSDVVEINDPNKQHTMGNFFGGPVSIIKNFLNFCNDFWSKHKEYSFNGTGIFSVYPEEVLLIKFLIDYDIKEKRLISQLHFENVGFMTNINAFGELIPNLKNFKLIHNIKHDIEFAKKILNSI
jgi:hypothetical protein